ncbi:TrbI/VirB10 family protein [Prosthecobacter sp.]|uniref:TrbI/VirB10 family protein n=1 Tax=Prosthecobacter sp. TaxID=1965333 RepID=UPI003782F4D6
MMQQLQKPAVQMLLLVVVVAIAGAAFYLSKQPAASVNKQPDVKNAKTGEVKPAPEASLVAESKTVNLGEKRTAMMGSVQQVDPFVVPTKKPPPPSMLSTSSSSAKKKTDKPPPFPKLVHVSNSVSEPFVPTAPKLFAPRGILIKAALVITVDSSSIQTPVVGLVTEDVYWNKQLVLPAGTQVHAQASKGRIRDRIEVKGAFTFIWDDGREYTINGVALDHQRLADDSYAITDGSAGVRGNIIQNDQYAQVKILIAEALQGIMNNNRQQFQSIYGLVPQNNTRNAALGGGAQAASAYSGMLTKQLSQDLDFVRVGAGTQFYIYTTDVFEPEMASIAGLRQKSQPVSSWQLAEETYARAQAENASASQQNATAAAEAEKNRKQAEAAAQVQQVRAIIAPAASAADSATDDSATTTPSSNP